MDDPVQGDQLKSIVQRIERPVRAVAAKLQRSRSELSKRLEMAGLE